MSAIFRLFVMIALLAFATTAGADDSPQRPISAGPDLSGFHKGRPTFGQLNKAEKNQIVLTRKYDKAHAKTLDSILRAQTTSDEKVRNVYIELMKARQKLNASERLFRDGLISNEKLKNDYILLASTGELVMFARRQYLSDLEQIYIRNEKKFKRVAEKFSVRASAWVKKINEMMRKQRRELNLPEELLDGISFKFDHWYNSEGYKEYDAAPKTADAKQQLPAGEPTGGEAGPGGSHYLVDDELNRTKIIKKEPPKPKGKLTARLEDDKPARKPAPKPACDVLGGKWHGGSLGQVKKLEASWRAALAKCASGPDCPTYRGEQSLQFYMRTMMIWQCHATFVKYGTESSKDDRKKAREEACATSKTLEKMAAQIVASRYMKAGANWIPLHVDMLEKLSIKDPCQAADIAEVKPKTKCKGGGLVGAMNCVTKKIDEAGSGPSKPPASASSTDPETGITTKSVRNPDGSRTVTKTDRDGNVISEVTVGKKPASVSSTHPAIGITTKSVRNPDGSRSVTKTDKSGNELSREVVGRDPASASATEINTGETTTSVANPDGSRTVTKTDAQGNILSRENVH